MIYETRNSPFYPLEREYFNLKVWLSRWYPRICRYLGINPNDDFNALKAILARYKSNTALNKLKDTVSGKKVCVIAPGPSLEKHISFLRSITNNYVLIAVDGATKLLVEQEIIPSIIVSDFDGNINAQLRAQQAGSILLLHVHGDNFRIINSHIDAVAHYQFVLTTQTDPLNGSFNFLGFSDGDRAICFSHYMKAMETLLLGFDFGDKIGRFSKNSPLSPLLKEKKLRKFTIAKSIINWCANNGANITIRK